MIAVPAIQIVAPSTLLRAPEVYQVDGLDFAEAYLITQAEAPGVNEIVSFDRGIERIATVSLREP